MYYSWTCKDIWRRLLLCLEMQPTLGDIFRNVKFIKILKNTVRSLKFKIYINLQKYLCQFVCFSVLLKHFYQTKNFWSLRGCNPNRSIAELSLEADVYGFSFSRDWPCFYGNPHGWVDELCGQKPILMHISVFSIGHPVTSTCKSRPKFTSVRNTVTTINTRNIQGSLFPQMLFSLKLRLRSRTDNETLLMTTKPP